VQSRAGAPQRRETAAASGGRKVRAQHQLVDGHRPHDSRRAAQGRGGWWLPRERLLTRSTEDAEHQPHRPQGLQGPDHGLLQSEDDQDQDHHDQRGQAYYDNAVPLPKNPRGCPLWRSSEFSLRIGQDRHQPARGGHPSRVQGRPHRRQDLSTETVPSQSLQEKG
jgi:hypothetical protein